ncbi:hypothetical protein [Halosimplex salinum]|uniref:hypothetical protein n=1 Tax=Halosimplex salinum TaxID=1710538 RepID=UPI001F3DB5C8|nr:hypothetical protein [Halosimplex salinum]
MLPSRYNLTNLRRVVRDPRRLRTEAAALGSRLNRAVAARRHPPGDAVAIMDEDWDNCFVLDACRYDLFAERHDLPGELRKVTSPGSQSLEFLEHNFAGETHHDTVYVTANPFATRLDDGVFHRVVDCFADEWDPDLGTVPPGAVADAARAARERYPEKRLLVHFMQPHYPFIGETGRSLDSGGVTGHVTGQAKTDEPTDSIWDRLAAGDAAVSTEAVWAAYAENFDLVAECAADLATPLGGKTVLTADHGNLFGERQWPVPFRRYGHPAGLRVPELVEVPWHELPADERRTVTADPPEQTDDVASDTVRDRLDHLGYA